MALNGVINPLAMVGQDAVWLDVFTEDFGLSKEDLLNDFFAGPTFQPWHWMGNLNGWGGPVDEAFLRQQQSLQRNITSAMVAFGMQPVLPAFAGHVPKQMVTKYPSANITHLPPWHGHFPVGTYFLSPSSSVGGSSGGQGQQGQGQGQDLFREIGEKFIQRQASALGVATWPGPHFYLADAYNEMAPPTTNATFLASVSRSMYDAMAAGDPQALMVTQGWFLSGVPHLPWGADQARAFLHGPPQGKLLVLDLNAIENPGQTQTAQQPTGLRLQQQESY
jgi:alpha-N-acetylglucosaminidase